MKIKILYKKIRANWDGITLVAKVSLVFVAVNILRKALAFITSPIFTRILTVEEYGQVSIWLSWQSMLAVLAMFCLSSGVFNNGMVDYPDQRDQYCFSMLVLSNLITIVVACTVALIVLCFGNVFGLRISTLYLMLIVFLTQPAYNFWITRQRYEYKYKTVAVVTLISSVLSPLIAVISIFLFRADRVISRLFGAEVPLIIVYAVFYVYLVKRSAFHLDTKYWSEALRFNLPLIPHYFSGYILNNSDRLMIAYLIDDTHAALYSLAYSISAIISSVWLGINSALIPYTYEKCKAKKYEDINQTTIPILLLFSCICIAIMLLAPEIIVLLAPGAYAESVYVVPPIVCGVFASALYYIFANIVYYYKKPRYVMYASGIAAITNIVLNYLLIPVYGYAAAAYTTLICYTLQAIIDYLAMRKVVGDRVYNVKIIVCIFVAMAFFSVLCTAFYPYTLLRYAILAGLLIIGFLFRNTLGAYLTALKGTGKYAEKQIHMTIERQNK